MAPERKNTSRLSLDTIASIDGLFGTISQAHAVLRLGSVGIPPRRFNLAMQHGFVTQGEVHTIETHWQNWRQHFMLPEHDKRTDYSLPEELYVSRPGVDSDAR